MVTGNKVELAAAKLILKLAFLVPKGTDLSKEIGEELVAFREAVAEQTIEEYTAEFRRQVARFQG